MPSVPGVINFPVSLDDIISLIDAKNVASSPLDAPIDSDDLFIPVTQIAEFSDSGIASIINSLVNPTQRERIAYTSKSGNNLVLQDINGRGQQGTTAQSWLAGAIVEQRPTARHHTALRDAIIAIQTKLGIGADTPGAAGEAFFSNGAGASLWRAIVVGDLPNLPISQITGLQTALDGKQPLDSDLTAIAALSANGFLRKISGVWQMSDPVTAWEASWCFPTIVAPETIGTEPRPVYFCPPGTSITVTQMRLVWRAGTHTNNTSTTFQIYRTNADGTSPTDLGQMTINNSGPSQGVSTLNDISNVVLTEGQYVACRINANTGTDTVQNVSVAAIGTQQPN